MQYIYNMYYNDECLT